MPRSRCGRLARISISAFLLCAVATSLLLTRHPTTKIDRVNNYMTIYLPTCTDLEPDVRNAPAGLQDWPSQNPRSPNCLTRCPSIGNTPCPSGIVSLAWSPDGRWLAAGGVDGLVHLIQLAEGRSAVTLAGHTSTVRAVAWSPDGLTIATAANDRTVRLWERDTGRLVQNIGSADRREGAWAIAWSPDSSLIATASENDTVVRLWRTRDGSLARTLRGHSLDVKSVAWSPDGTMLARLVLTARYGSGRGRMEHFSEPSDGDPTTMPTLSRGVRTGKSWRQVTTSAPCDSGDLAMAP